MSSVDKNVHRQNWNPEHEAKLGSSVTYKFYGPFEEIAYTPGTSMCYVIVTVRSMLWTLLTILSTLAIVGAIITPQWLIGSPTGIALRTSIEVNNQTYYQYTTEKQRTYRPTIGIFNRCVKMHQFETGDYIDSCHTYVTGFQMHSRDFPDPWKCSLVLFTIGVILLIVTNIAAVFSLCVQAICRKSIFTLSGLLQSIAGKGKIMEYQYSSRNYLHVH